MLVFHGKSYLSIVSRLGKAKCAVCLPPHPDSGVLTLERLRTVTISEDAVFILIFMHETAESLNTLRYMHKCKL